ncbi:MAG: precorrin-6y C5,15-methyltransferase (decarboxylating) subunit CbiE [Cypionkella sp.]|uniref:precorrin-6y C5,15-methyltransferase (decarboxylating) subunit CbiE n=1 Tax=Cypionkella sp. TaxID=2811411 RepID=UPI002AB919E3|nr:precorrin-6y C5,15-methyltransferase (decarboxylating) subunit CbiE [Cypionkella sp.]MDZ4311102.1 precorrin-6y C5,15-methyltransferase (decarboxylating) subunit CbiE [Cypionkella sp.]
MGKPWVAIIGLGEDGLAGLSDASREALDRAEIIFGGPRHLALVGAGDKGRAWPVPFSVAPVLACKGQNVAILASGDPFWFGAGSSLTAHLQRDEWQAYPAPSSFQLAAAQLGWRMEDIICHGLHAAPFARLRPVLTKGARAICLLRDGDAPQALAAWLTDQGFAANLTVLECLGGPNQRIRQTTTGAFALTGIKAPVAVAFEITAGKGLPRASGLDDALFANDGQITKRPVRALTLSALAPRAGEVLWDIGAGSGSISVEWCLAGGRALAFELRPDRAVNIRTNAASFGIDHRLTCIEGSAAESLVGHPLPDAVFIGGGGNAALYDQLWQILPAGSRIVANGVTLETESLLAAQHAQRGGSLLRIDLAQAAPLGRMRGWDAARPVVQWSVIR